MKEFWKTWQFLTAVVAVILLIVAVVLYFVSPKFCYAASGLLIGTFAGFIGGYFVGNRGGAKVVRTRIENKPREEKPQYITEWERIRKRQ